jgi:hypothetical protein
MAEIQFVGNSICLKARDGFVVITIAITIGITTKMDGTIAVITMSIATED